MLDENAMNIETEPGSLVRFSHPTNGYTHHQESAAKLLTVGYLYTVEKTVVGSWHTDVYLKEFPGKRFNSVLFSNV